MTPYAPAFTSFPAPVGRSVRKPRDSGLSSLLDYGLSLGAQRDLLESDGSEARITPSQIEGRDALPAKEANRWRSFGFGAPELHANSLSPCVRSPHTRRRLDSIVTAEGIHGTENSRGTNTVLPASLAFLRAARSIACTCFMLRV